jgi:hypothetical protein
MIFGTTFEELDPASGFSVTIVLHAFLLLSKSILFTFHKIRGGAGSLASLSACLLVCF